MYAGRKVELIRSPPELAEGIRAVFLECGPLVNYGGCDSHIRWWHEPLYVEITPHLRKFIGPGEPRKESSIR